MTKLRPGFFSIQYRRLGEFFAQLPALGYFCNIVFITRSMLRGIRIRKEKGPLWWVLPVLALFLSSGNLRAQCAMCRAVVEQGGEEVAEGINSGIVYLMAFPYLVVAVASYLFYRNWKRSSAAS